MSRVLVVIFGGADFELIRRFGLSNLQLENFGRTNTAAIPSTEPDELIATLLTGVTRSGHGIRGSMHFTNERVQWIENRLPNVLPLVRRSLYQTLDSTFDWFECERRRYVASDFQSPTLFDTVPCARPISVPSYNPEPQWCIFRNTIRDYEYEALGFAEANELIEKNYHWRLHQLRNHLNDGNSLLMIHFQFIDSYQHIYYEQKGWWGPVKEAYRRIDQLAGEILERGEEAGFDQIVYLSEHGRPRRDHTEVHHRNGFFASTSSFGKEEPRLSDVHRRLLDWSR